VQTVDWTPLGQLKCLSQFMLKGHSSQVGGGCCGQRGWEALSWRVTKFCDCVRGACKPSQALG
jgi:hypothetical protein